jgi:hypothetical protein
MQSSVWGVAAVVSTDGVGCEQCRTQDHVERDGCARDEGKLAALRAQFHDAMAVSTALSMHARAQRTGGVGRQCTKAEEAHATTGRAAAALRMMRGACRDDALVTDAIVEAADSVVVGARSSVRCGAPRSVRAKETVVRC